MTKGPFRGDASSGSRSVRDHPHEMVGPTGELTGAEVTGAAGNPGADDFAKGQAD